jgi:cyclase
VAGNIFMLEGDGAGNIAAAVGGDVFIDDQYAPLAEKIQAALKSVTDNPARFIINTHIHGDHTGGNAYFQKQSPIIAQPRSQTSGERWVCRQRQRHTYGHKAGASRCPAHHRFRSCCYRCTSTAKIIRALCFPAGHTDGDSIVFFPHSNVVHMGDDFVTCGFPFIDAESGAASMA